MNNIKTAKRSAAFKTCMLLYYMGELDDHFKPNTTNYLNSIKDIYFNHWLQFTDKIDFELDIREYRLYKNIFPDQFVSCYPKVNAICYLYIIRVFPADVEHSHDSAIVQSLIAKNSYYGILLTKKLPKFALINLFPSFGEVSVQIEETPIAMRFETESEINLLRRFHFFLIKDILKLWKDEYIPENNSFIIVPVKGDQINWKLVETFDILPACRKKSFDEAKCMEFKPNDYLYKVVTPWYRSEHFCIVTKIRDDKNPLSKFPNPDYLNYYEYYKSAHGVTISNKSQFLIEVKLLKGNLNFLNSEHDADKRFNRQKILLVPELCHNYVFPAEMWIKATLLPSTLHRLNHLLLADNLRSMLAQHVQINDNLNVLPIEVDDFCKKQTYNDDFSYLNDSLLMEHLKLNDSNEEYSSSSEDLSDTSETIENYDKIKMLQNNKIKSIQQKDILKALTTASAGDVFSLEKVEILGDAFLKFSVSFYLFYKHPERHEGFLTAAKNFIINNRNLYYCGLKTGIPGLMKPFKFHQNNWLPPLITTSEILNFKPNPKVTERKPRFYSHREQPISDKSIADCIEALLGVCSVSLGIQESFKILQLFKIIPYDDVFDNIGKYRNEEQQSNIDNQSIRKCEQILGYRFQNKVYLMQALTHPSCISSYFGCYQKLEFLGDAVLDYLITAYLFEHCKDFSPGKITDIRSAIVNNTTLSCLCVKNNLHQFIFHESGILGETIKKFEKYQIENNHKLTDNVQIQEADIADSVNIPKALGDVFEALLGAIFLDSYHNLELVWNILYKLISEELHEFIENIPINLVRQLHEFPDAKYSFSNAQPMENGVVIQVKFWKNGVEMKAFGVGKNKNDAKKAAAKMALQTLSSN